MIIKSWNCRGMGSKRKEEALKDIMKTSKASILLLQETKMSQQDALKTLLNVWKGSLGVAENARGILRRTLHTVECLQNRHAQL
jgi:exonuclease III